MKTQKQGFTVVELVIVVAVVAVLAAVLIPTFSDIVKKANISSDTKMARNMTLILQAESADSPAPVGPKEAVDLLKANGIERLHPKTKFYSFYWIKSRNIVLLADEGDRVVYPEEMLGEQYDPDDWFDLTEQYAAATTITEKEDDPVEPPVSSEPPAEDEETEPPITEEQTEIPSHVTVTYTCNKPQWLQSSINSCTLQSGETYSNELTLSKNGQYWMSKITVYKGGVQYDVIRCHPGEDHSLSFANVTEDIEINIHIIEYCIITFEGEGIKNPGIVVKCQKGLGCLFEIDDLQKHVIDDVSRITDVKVMMGDRELDVYDAEKQTIHITSVTDNVTITFTVENEQSP